MVWIWRNCVSSSLSSAFADFLPQYYRRWKEYPPAVRLGNDLDLRLGNKREEKHNKRQQFQAVSEFMRIFGTNWFAPQKWGLANGSKTPWQSEGIVTIDTKKTMHMDKKSNTVL